MVKQVLCTCIWCLQESNGQEKSVGKTTRARHIIKQNKTWTNPTDMPVLQRHLVTPISQTISIASPSISTIIPLLTNITKEISNHNYEKDINLDFFENMSEKSEETISEQSFSDEEDQIEVLEYEENEDDDNEYDEEDNSNNDSDDNYNNNDERDNDNNNENEGDDEGNIEEEDNKEYDGEISEDLIEGLQLLKIKNKYNISEAAFNEILKVFKISKVSLFKLRKLRNIVPLEPTLINCCINSCVVFTGELINEDHYPYCGKFCYKSSQVA